jgi:hypothetical protein
MAWSWSHTNEAYEAVRLNIERQDREWLEVVWAEWIAAIPDPRFGIGFHAELDTKKYHKALVRAKRKSNDELAAFIWERTRDFATCENGGFEAWCCPFGCGCHMVSFDTPSDVEEPNPQDCSC